jgi:hypothetical protein
VFDLTNVHERNLNEHPESVNSALCQTIELHNNKL